MGVLGMALIVGTPNSPGGAAAICRELQEKYMLTFLAGGVIPSLSFAGVKLGLITGSSPLGPNPSTASILLISSHGSR